MIEIHFRQKTQILAVDRVLPSINLKHRNFPVAINFVPGRMFNRAFQLPISHVREAKEKKRKRERYAMPPSHPIPTHILETEFTNTQDALPGIFFRVWTSIMGFYAIITEIDGADFECCFCDRMTTRARRNF